jgi:hypothetical protein
MKIRVETTRRKPVFMALLLLSLVFGSTGCQTFSMTREEFAKQQHGEMADPETGKIVATVGPAAYYGALFGAFLAGLK